jgi:hypothetical protein
MEPLLDCNAGLVVELACSTPYICEAVARLTGLGTGLSGLRNEA